MSKQSRGALLIELRKAREIIEESERASLAEDTLASVPRLERVGRAISACVEIESRMAASIASERQRTENKTGGNNEKTI